MSQEEVKVQRHVLRSFTVNVDADAGVLVHASHASKPLLSDDAGAIVLSKQEDKKGENLVSTG